MMHGVGPVMYKRQKWGGEMRKYPEPFVMEDSLEKKPTLGGRDWWRERFGRNPGGSMGRPVPTGRPAPNAAPKEKSEIELYLERIGHVRR